MKSKLLSILHPSIVYDGAGVRINRVFGFHDTDLTDPFLLLDNFGSDNPEDYEKGFPWHPHRGIETVTYMMDGFVEHGDSLGNKGRLGPGDIQWMTAGSGIIHQEMPKRGESYKMYGFQLWVNLPQKEKMSHPRYQEFSQSFIPEVNKNDCLIKIIAGTIDGVEGLVQEISIRPVYLDVHIPEGKFISFPVESGDKILIYCYEGKLILDSDQKTDLKEKELAVLISNGEIGIDSSLTSGRFLLIAGTPLNEPVAWGGPIVMNTKEELDLAFKELNQGTFIKKHSDQ